MLELRSIVSPGDLANERITMRAKSDLNVGDYLLAQSGYADESPTINFFHTYWFPYKRIENGDLVVVYTKRGTERTGTLTNTGKKAHFYYLDLATTIWDKPERGAVLLHAPTWQSKPANEL